MPLYTLSFFFFQAEDGIRDLVRSRGLGDVYKRQHLDQLPMFLRNGAILFRRDVQDYADETPIRELTLSLIHI